jgi:hypothetical protein
MPFARQVKAVHRMRFLTLVALAAIVAFGPAPGVAGGGEVWISPKSYQIPVGTALVANLCSGSRLAGKTEPFVPQNAMRFDVYAPGSDDQVRPESGEMPALTMEAPREGLNIIVHETMPQVREWNDWDDFAAFVRQKDMPWALGDHRSRGLPEAGFSESYSWFAKSLVAVGSGMGTDRSIGLETEIVVLGNPYTDDLSKGLPVQVLYQGQPRKEVQVEVLVRQPDGSVAQSLFRTDGEGRIILPVAPGAEYLVEAMLMRPVPGNVTEGTPVWESLWASETFKVPGSP